MKRIGVVRQPREATRGTHHVTSLSFPPPLVGVSNARNESQHSPSAARMGTEYTGVPAVMHVTLSVNISKLIPALQIPPLRKQTKSSPISYFLAC